MKIIKKINIFVFTVIIFFMPLIHGMEQATTEFNQQFSLIHLPKEIHYNICNHPFNNNDQTNKLSNYLNQINNLYNLIKSALALRSTCTYFNKLLTAEQIGKFCTPYNQEAKDDMLKKFSKMSYEKLRFPSLILIYAKAKLKLSSCYLDYSLLNQALRNNDLSFTNILLQYKAELIKEKTNYLYRPPLFPTFFYAQTKEAAQLLVKHGADIHIKDEHDKTNILWYLINGRNFSQDFFQETKLLDLFQFYLDEGVDSKIIHSSDKACLFHHLIEYCEFFKDSDCDIKLAEILFTKIPNMINTKNKNNQTPLDIAIEKTTYYKYENNLKKLENLITFLKKHEAKTAQELEEIKKI